MPPVFDGQIVQRPQNAGEADPREAVNGKNFERLSTDSRRHSPDEVFCRQQVIQVCGDRGLGDGMIQSCNATMDKSEQVIMSLRETKIVRSSAQR